MLPRDAFRRADESADEQFYHQPRLVKHIDDAAIRAVTQLYREIFPPGSDILDLMSSWVSHLPPEISYGQVIGLGMNEAELRANPRLDRYVLHNLNHEPALPFADRSFGGAAICVSIQYLTQPATVLRDIGRVLRPGAPLVITYSNRCFPTKAVAVWQMLDDAGHGDLITRYLEQAGNWMDIVVLNRSPRGWRSDPLYAVVARTLADAGPFV